MRAKPFYDKFSYYNLRQVGEILKNPQTGEKLKHGVDIEKFPLFENVLKFIQKQFGAPAIEQDKQIMDGGGIDFGEWYNIHTIYSLQIDFIVFWFNLITILFTY